jgi:hypothetical protein
MPSYTQGDTRITLTQAELIAGQNDGSLVIDSQRSRPYWFDGRFLAARDLQREQDYFLQRQADLGQAAGFSVIHGLRVDTPPANSPSSNGDTVIVRAGQGLTPAGELVLLPNDITIDLGDLPDEQNLDVQVQRGFDPQHPGTQSQRSVRSRASASRVHSQSHRRLIPTSIQGTRTTHDGDIVEATAIALVPYPSPVNWTERKYSGCLATCGRRWPGKSSSTQTPANSPTHCCRWR